MCVWVCERERDVHCVLGFALFLSLSVSVPTFLYLPDWRGWWWWRRQCYPVNKIFKAPHNHRVISSKHQHVTGMTTCCNQQDNLIRKIYFDKKIFERVHRSMKTTDKELSRPRGQFCSRTVYTSLCFVYLCFACHVICLTQTCLTPVMTSACINEWMYSTSVLSNSLQSPWNKVLNISCMIFSQKFGKYYF